MSTLTTSEWNEIFKILDGSKTQREIAKEYGISHTYVSIKYMEHKKKQQQINSKGNKNDNRGNNSKY